MKNTSLILSLLAISIFATQFSYADSPKKAKQPPSPSPSASPTDTTTPSPTPGPQWVPPPSTETYFDNQTNRLVEKISTKILVNSFYQTDATGNFMESMVDLDFKRKFDAYPIGAEADIRFGKNFDNSYNTA